MLCCPKISTPTIFGARESRRGSSIAYDGKDRMTRSIESRSVRRRFVRIRSAVIAAVVAFAAIPSISQTIEESVAPSGPPFVLSPSADINRPPISYLPMRPRPRHPRQLRSWKAMRDEGEEEPLEAEARRQGVN